MDNFSKSSEYAVQLLTYPPKTIVDFVLGTLDSAVTECMEAMGKSLLLSSLVQDIPKSDIEKGLDQLKSRFVKKMEPITGKLEKFLLDVVLSIPDHVLLPEDSNQRSKYSTKVLKRITKDIETLKSEIQAEKLRSSVYKGKHKEALETLENLKAASLEIENTALQVFNDNTVFDIQENASFIRNNFQCLNDKIDCLHNVLPQSKPSGNELTF